MAMYGFSEHSRIVQCSIQFQRYSHLVLCIYCPVTLYIALLVRDCNLDIILCQMPANAVSFIYLASAILGKGV